MKKTIKAFSARAAMMLLATLLLTMTAQTAWADDPLPLPAADGNGNVTISTPGTYTASGHIYGNLIINTSGEVILNVDNLTLDRDDDSSNYDGEILLENGTLTLNISNDKILKARKVMATTLAMTGGTISANNVDANTINMSAGLIEAYNFDAGGTISGGRITVQNFTAGYNTYQDFITLTISGGTITVNGTFYIYDLEINASTPGLSITANTYDISSWHSVLSITGGNVTDGTNTYNSDNDSVESLKGYLASNSNVTLTVAGSTPVNNTYTVTFNANGGTGDAMSDQTFTMGETKALYSCTYTREGYTFDGWAIAANGDKVYDNGASVSNLVSAGESFTLYAHWTANTYTVRFAANGGDGGDQMADQAFTYDAAQNLTACTYTRTGYTFAGWATTHEGDVEYTNEENVNNLTTTADETVEFFAKWTPISYTVTFNANGGQGDQMPNQAFTYDAAQNLNPLGYSRNGYTFAGWAMTPDGDVAYTNEENVNNLTTTADETVEFFAKWTPISYTVTFNANGGDGGDQMADQAFAYDAAQDLTACTYTHTGYTFAGWAVTPDGDVAYTNGQNVNNLTMTAGATVMLFAKWTPITYTVTFDRNGGDGGDQMADQAFTYDAAQDLTACTYTRTGYTFAGWATTAEGDVEYTNGQSVRKLTTTADATVEFFAKWTPITYTVTFNANGGDGGDQMADQAFTYDAAQNLRDCSYTLTGYTFAGWAMTPDGDVAYTNGQNVNNLTTTADATVMLFAKWTPISYTVRFAANGGDGGDQMADQAFTYDAAQDLTACTYTRTGYTFAGWATTHEGDVEYTNEENVNNLTTTADETVEFFAKWTPISYTVTFNANGGDGGDQMADQAFTYDEAQNLRDCSYTLTGYTFAGWAMTPDGDVAYTNGQNVNNLTTTAGATVMLFAKWTPITYTVTFDRNGGDGGDQMADQAFTYDAAQDLTACTYTHTGYAFAGWAMTPDGDVAYTNGQNVNNLTTTAGATVMLFAKWTPISYTVTFDRNGGDGGDQMADQAFTYDEAQNLRDCSYTLTGYAFAGWAVTPDGDVAYTNGQNVNNLTMTADATVMLFAKWTASTYTVTLDRQDGEVDTESVTATYDADMPAITPPTMLGYTFGGYYTETDGGGTQYYNADGTSTRTWNIDEATTLYAKWEIVRIEIGGITYEWKSETNTFKVAKYNGTSSSLIIPESVEYNHVSYYVTEIGVEAFMGKSYLESIDMPDVITKISERAFKNCSNLSEIHGLPDNLTIIEAEAFSGSGLTEITIPEGVERIDERAFAACPSLTSVTIPGRDMELAGNAFDGCNGDLIIYVPEDQVDDYRDSWPNILAVGTIPIPYIAADGSEAYCDEYIVLNGSNGDEIIKITQEDGCDGWYVVKGKVTYSAGLFIEGHNDDVNLILCDDAELSLSGGDYAFGVSGYHFNIFGQTNGTGKVVTTNSECGIYASVCSGDGYSSLSSGSFTINGGTIEATGEYNGINVYGGAFTINGGTIETTGDEKGIYASQDITINSGTVNATGSGSYGYGICSNEGKIEINGGVVVANGSSSGSGIEAMDGCIVLNWTNASDRITASSFTTAAPEGTSIVSGKAFTDDQGNIYGGTLSQFARDAIADKILTPATSVALAAKEVTVSGETNFWTTFYCGAGFSIDAEENACAYTATYEVEDEVGTITLHKLGRVIPKNTAVIIVGADASISMTVSDAVAEYSVEGNDLHGVDAATPLEDVKTDLEADAILVLSNKNSHFGFHDLATTNVPARKAFLAINEQSGARQFTMVFDDATGIHSIDNGQLIMDNEAGAWYSLDGRRLTGKPTQKGLYIHNGTKVTIK